MLADTLAATEKLLAALATQGAASQNLLDDLADLETQLTSLKLSNLAQAVRAVVVAPPTERLARIARIQTALQQLRLRLLKPQAAPFPNQRLILSKTTRPYGRIEVTADPGDNSPVSLGQLLASPNDLTRTWAANELVAHGDAGVPVLQQTALARPGCVSKLVVFALKAIGTDDALTAIVRLAEQDVIKRYVVETLVGFGARAIAPIMAAPNVTNPTLLQALWWLEKGTARPNLSRLLAQHNLSGRWTNFLAYMQYAQKQRDPHQHVVNWAWDKEGQSFANKLAIFGQDDLENRFIGVALWLAERPDDLNPLFGASDSLFRNSARRYQFDFLWGSGLEKPLLKHTTDRVFKLVRANVPEPKEADELVQLGDFSTLQTLLYLAKFNPTRYERPIANLTGNLLEGSLLPLARQHLAQGRELRAWKETLEKLIEF